MATNKQSATKDTDETASLKQDKRIEHIILNENSDQISKTQAVDVANLQILDTRMAKKGCTKEKASNCCRIFTTFLISRVGLFILMSGYMMLGGLLFQELEEENERLSIMRGVINTETLVQKIYEKAVYSSAHLNDKEYGEFLTLEIE